MFRVLDLENTVPGGNDFISCCFGTYRFLQKGLHSKTSLEYYTVVSCNLHSTFADLARTDRTENLG